MITETEKNRREKIRIAHLGSKNPMFGKVTSDEVKAKISKALTGRKYKKWSIESRNKISLQRKGRVPKNKGTHYKLHLNEEQKERRSQIGIARKGHYSVETRKKMSESAIVNVGLPRQENQLEVLIQVELIKRQILFYREYVIPTIARVDFYLPDHNIIIECDGCYWHNCLEHYPEYHKEQRVKDITKDAKLKARGITVFRIWEHDIKKSAKECLDLLNI
jgi:very-short-patch-repair endonuclease